MQTDNNTNEEKDEFKLSFKPSTLTMNANNGSTNQQWMTSSLNNNIANSMQFMNQSPSSILLSGYNDNINNNNNNNNNKNTSNISMFNPMNNSNNNNNNASIINTTHLPTDSEVIFNESVPIIVKASMIETNTRHLTLKIEKLVEMPQNQQILSITLTDQSDPFFLYKLSVSENDFHRLKSDQTLLVDFAVFPKSLVMLLQQCLQCKNMEHPKFVAVLVYSSSNNNNNHSNHSNHSQNGGNYAILSVQETNQFRHLQHISLKLSPASADKLREYLGKSLMIYRSEAISLNNQLCETKKVLNRLKIDKKQTEQYVNQIKQKYEQCLCDLKTSHSQQISLLKQNNLEQNEEIRKELINNKNDLEKELKIQIKTMNLKYNKLKDQFDELNTNKLTLENKYKNKTEILNQTKNQFDLNKKELNELRIECKKLDQLKFKNEKEINEHLINISALQQQIKDKGEIAMNNTNLLNSEREQKKSMEEQLNLYKLNLEKTEKKVKECIKEINKGNNIISHLQNEIRNQRNKNKLKEQKIYSMEQMNNNKSDDMNRLNTEIKQKQDVINKYKSENKELKNTLRACKDKLQETQKAIESNQRVISYLNKQLNDNQLNNNIFSNNNNNNNQLLAAMTPSPYNNNHKNHNNSTPYTAISGLTNISAAISPILHNDNNNNNNNKPSVSSYFPQ